jgi:hypothetical protein
MNDKKIIELIFTALPPVFAQFIGLERSGLNRG